MAEATYVSKMSIKTLGCRPKLAAVLPENDKTVVALARFYGRADGLKVIEDKNTGDNWTALKGSFEGVNLETNEVFKSGILFLPGGIQDIVESAVVEMEKAQEDGTMGKDITVKFALEIGSVRATNKAGYSYQAVSLVPAAADDELSGMRLAIAQRPVKGNVPVATQTLPAPPVPQPQIAAPVPPTPAPVPAPAGRRK